MKDSYETESDYCVVATIGGTYGVHGWIKLTVRSESIEQFLEFDRLFIQAKPSAGSIRGERGSTAVGQPESWYPFSFLELKEHGRGLIARLPGSTTKEQAAQFTGRNIGVLRSALPELASGDYYWDELIGMAVYSSADELLGDVKDLLETGANDVLVVGPTEDSLDQRERLIPYLVGTTVLEIDETKKKILVDWDSQF